MRHRRSSRRARRCPTLPQRCSTSRSATPSCEQTYISTTCSRLSAAIATDCELERAGRLMELSIEGLHTQRMADDGERAWASGASDRCLAMFGLGR